MTDQDAFVELLTRRHGILAALVEEPRTRHVLVDALADSKTTVYKGVSQLLDAGLLESRDRTLHPTLAGRVALDRYRSLAGVARLPALLAPVPPDALNPVVLDGCDVITPDSRSFDRHIVYGERVLRDATAVEGTVPAVSEETLSVFGDRVVDAGVAASLVLTDDVVDHLSDAYPGLLETFRDLPEVDLWRTDESFAFGLLVVESGSGSRMAVEVYDDGVPLGVLVNESDESVRWARDAIEGYRSAATAL